MPTRRADPQAHGNRPWSADGGGHHGGGGQRPGHREIDVAEQDHQHEARCHDAEEGSHLKLLQEILRLQERRASLRQDRIARTDKQDEQHETGCEDHRLVVRLQAKALQRGCRGGGPAHRNTSSLFFRRSSFKPPRLTAARRTTPSKSG